MAADREKRVEGYREASRKADELAVGGRRDEALALLKDTHAAAVEAGDEDYRLFFEAELANYQDSDSARAIELMGAALAWVDEHGLAPDYFLLRNMGVHHSHKGDLDAAIEWFDKALAANPDDSDAMRSKAVSLSKKGGLNAAFEWFDKALAANPDDSDAMRNEGISLSKRGDEDAAIEWYDKA
ncbi:MAG TPA: tetratricopeptide repeat protein, partial [Armatimonadota bacterium]|nr:tetratricopeptide repeat protein [Armatimonadota bacterium]